MRKTARKNTFYHRGGHKNYSVSCERANLSIYVHALYHRVEEKLTGNQVSSKCPHQRRIFTTFLCCAFKMCLLPQPLC